LIHHLTTKDARRESAPVCVQFTCKQNESNKKVTAASGVFNCLLVRPQRSEGGKHYLTTTDARRESAVYFCVKLDCKQNEFIEKYLIKVLFSICCRSTSMTNCGRREFA